MCAASLQNIPAPTLWPLLLGTASPRGPPAWIWMPASRWHSCVWLCTLPSTLYTAVIGLCLKCKSNKRTPPCIPCPPPHTYTHIHAHTRLSTCLNMTYTTLLPPFSFPESSFSSVLCPLSHATDAQALDVLSFSGSFPCIFQVLMEIVLTLASHP